MRRRILQDEVNAAARHQNGALIIPSFAVERTQELLADLAFLMEQGKIPECPVIIDSPLATRATEIFKAHASELDNGDLLARAIRSRFVRFTESVEQSKALDFVKGFHVVIAASGMCEAGRNPPQAEKLAVAGGGDGASRRLPGGWNARAYTPGRCGDREDPGRRDRREGEDPFDRCLQRACRWWRAGGLALRPKADPPRSFPGAW